VTEPARPLLPARIGALLASPVRRLAEIDALGTGGIRDVTWLVVVGAVCLRLQDIWRALLGIADGNLVAALRQTLGIFAQELQLPVVMSIAAALIITVAAGRGRRDPSTDVELGAACYPPAFLAHLMMSLRGVGATAAKPSTVIPASLADTIVALALAWMILLLVLAVRTTRRRPHKGDGVLDRARLPLPVSTVSLRDRIAVTSLAAVLGAVLLINAAGVARHGRVAPGFALPRVDGKPGTVALTDLRGKVVLLDFWATWCAPCLEMLPTMDQLYGEFHPRGVEFVGINSDGPSSTVQDVREFLRRRPISYPVVVDEGEVGGRYDVTSLPHLVVLGRDGAISRVFFGLTRRAELARALDRAIND
jgi:thiol-disulfide isomerase/thioredoxin